MDSMRQCLKDSGLVVLEEDQRIKMFSNFLSIQSRHVTVWIFENLRTNQLAEWKSELCFCSNNHCMLKIFGDYKVAAMHV